MQRRLVHHEEQERIMKRYMLAILLLNLTCLLAPAQAIELGRLFFTPQQREQLDLQQSSGNGADHEKHNYIIVNGVVQKHGGNRTVWINGVAQPAERGHDRNPTVESVVVPGTSRAVKLKVGEPLPLQAPAPGSEADK
jgi:hypothetical protein